jgi:hypothetical protein
LADQEHALNGAAMNGINLFFAALDAFVLVLLIIYLAQRV